MALKRPCRTCPTLPRRRVERLSEYAVELAYRIGEIRFWRLDEEMKVIVREAKGMNDDAEARNHRIEHQQEGATIVIIQEDRLPGVSPRGSVIGRAWEFDPKRAGH